jgi:hypothetical protein
MSARKDLRKGSFTAKDLEFLADFFTGKALGELSISYEDAMKSIREISEAVDDKTKDPSASVATFISQLVVALN